VIDARQRRVGFLVAGCFFMEIMDGTIVSTAAPRLSEALRVPVSSIGLLITAYFVTLAVFIPSSGWLVSRWGRERSSSAPSSCSRWPRCSARPAPAWAS
jgi:MFS family permease